MTELAFGPFVMDVGAGRLVRDGEELKLRPRAFQALRVLLQHQGQPLGYEQMMSEAWDGTFVSRHTVDVTVSEVKKALGEYGAWIVHRAKVGYSLDVPSSVELVRRGWHFWNRRTREGAELAIKCFEEAAAECRGDFHAFEGLSTCYLMMATFGMKPPNEVYPKFLDAHEKAVALAGVRAELRCNRAHGLHLFERRLDEAEAEFAQARRDKPSFGTTYVRTSMLCATLGRLDEALDLVARGYDVDPLLPTLPAAEVNVRIWRREFEVAVDLGRRAVELHPYLQISRANYAQALEFAGRLDEALAQYRLGSLMSPDLPWMRALEGTCLAKLGRRQEAMAIFEELDALRRTDYVDALYMAVLREALGQSSEALGELDRAHDERSAFLYSMNVDPKMDVFRGDRRLQFVPAVGATP